MDLNVIKLENNNNYVIMDAFNIENDKYLILVNEKDNTDICVRKIEIENGKEYLVKLESNEELDKVMTKYYDINKKGDSNE